MTEPTTDETVALVATALTGLNDAIKALRTASDALDGIAEPLTAAREKSKQPTTLISCSHVTLETFITNAWAAWLEEHVLAIDFESEDELKISPLTDWLFEDERFRRTLHRHAITWLNGWYDPDLTLVRLFISWTYRLYDTIATVEYRNGTLAELEREYDTVILKYDDMQARAARFVQSVAAENKVAQRLGSMYNLLNSLTSASYDTEENI